jgi:hypothetical protein
MTKLQLTKLLTQGIITEAIKEPLVKLEETIQLNYAPASEYTTPIIELNLRAIKYHEANGYIFVALAIKLYRYGLGSYEIIKPIIEDIKLTKEDLKDYTLEEALAKGWELYAGEIRDLLEIKILEHNLEAKQKARKGEEAI